MKSGSNSLVRNVTKTLGDLPTAILTSFFSDTASLYEVLGVQPGVGYYLNLGWWPEELSDRDFVNRETITEACRELVRQFASFGDVQPDDTLLDVGFGFAQQDVLLCEEFGCRDITGINITPYHVETGRERLESNDVSENVALHLGDAVNLPYPSGHFDKVFALESAFHFHTRQDFFEEAFRVLQPGGRILTADIIDGPARSTSNSILTSLLCEVHENYWNIPEENRTNSKDYEESLKRTGFSDVTIRNVSDKVLTPWVHNYLRWRLSQQPFPLNKLGLPYQTFLENFYSDDYFRYVFCRARK